MEKYANSEHALCVLNHRGDLDWMIGWVLIERMGMLGVSVRYTCTLGMRCRFTVIILCGNVLPPSSYMSDMHSESMAVFSALCDLLQR